VWICAKSPISLLVLHQRTTLLLFTRTQRSSYFKAQHKLGPTVLKPALTLLAVWPRASRGPSLSSIQPHPQLSLQQECCGTSGPMDWVNYTSAFRGATPEVVFPWPPVCCRRTGNFIPLNKEGCRLGHVDYLFTKVCPLLLLHLGVLLPLLFPLPPLPLDLPTLGRKHVGCV
jgi:hypothetical protein